MSSKSKIIVFLMVICAIDNARATQKSCQEMTAQDWCKNYELCTCANVFKTYFLFKDCITMECIFFQISIVRYEDIPYIPSVIQRYIQYIKIGKQHQLTNLLFWSDWCIKIKNQCMEKIRLLGFKIEVYAVKRYYNDQTAKPNPINELVMDNKKYIEKLPKSDVYKYGESLKNYIKNLNRTNPKDVETYCAEECTAKASNNNFTDASFLQMKRTASIVKNDTSSNDVNLIFKDEISEENKKEGFDRCLPRLQVVTKSLPQLYFLSQYYKNMKDFCIKECI